MPKVSTDKNLIEKFLTRGVENLFPSAEALRKKLMSGERLKAYQGFDPSGPYLHIGHAMGMRALRILQELGHEVIILVGDFTAIAGDPSDGKKRTIMTDREIKKNMGGWKKQASQIINFSGKNPAKFVRNSTWLSKLTLREIIELMSKTTVQQILERDLYQRKLKANDPIRLHEFIYPIMQGYDSVAMKVDIEIGGNDQIFNMLVGRTLVKEFLGKEKFVRSHELMEAPDTVTMSKTKGNGINLSDSSNDIYGKAMSYPDELILKAFRLLTDIPSEEIWQMQEQIEKGKNPMEFKKKMAFEVTKMIKGEKEAEKARKHFKKTVQQREITSEESEKVQVSGKMPVLKFLKEVSGEKSTSQIKRVIEQGGVEINNKKVTDPHQEIEFNKGTMVKFGKRKYFEVE